MKNKILRIGQSIVFVWMCVVLVACQAKQPPEKTIAIVSKGEAHAFWQSVKAGAESAGEKYGYNITFRGMVSESAKEIPNQREMLQSALSNQPSAIVLATLGTGFVDLLTQAYDRGIPVVQFDSGIWQADVACLDQANENPIISSVATDNVAAGALAAEYFYEAIKQEIVVTESYVVGVIQHDESLTGVERVKGFSERFIEIAEADPFTAGKCQLAVEVKPSDEDHAYKIALEALYEKGVSAVFMSNEGVVKQVYDAIGAADTKYDDIRFCGFDAGSKQIEWMKSTTGPKLVGSIAQDSFQIGFQSVEQAVFAVEGRKDGRKEKNGISGEWWDCTNVDEMIARNLVYQG